jgi:hypothetical protein
MVNAWTLLYDEMENFEDRYEDTMKKDPVKHSEFWYDYDRNDLDRPNPFVAADASPDTITFTGDIFSEDAYNFGAAQMVNMDYANDTINLNMDDKIELNLESTEKNGFWKYEEDKTMKEIRDYLSSTYNAHYTSPDSKTQTLDLIEAIGDAEPFCRSNAIKYLSRFGRKGGKSKMDILKAIHYCVLLYHFSGIHNQPKGNYETF